MAAKTKSRFSFFREGGGGVSNSPKTVPALQVNGTHRDSSLPTTADRGSCSNASTLIGAERQQVQNVGGAGPVSVDAGANGRTRPGKEGPGRRQTFGGRVSGAVVKRFQSVRALEKQIFSPPPTSPDGLSSVEASPTTSPPSAALHPSLWQDIVGQAKQGRILKDGKALLQVLESTLGKPVNDREMMLENLVEMLSSLEINSETQRKLSDLFVKVLYSDLDHPPTVLLGSSHRFRTADGSHNSSWLPDIGKAGLPYARSVTPVRVLPQWLPEPGIIFDAVLKRREFKPHPSGISSLLFSFATLIIHTLFRTKRSDPAINETSSYLDLSVLYGHDQAHQDRVRSHENGKIWPDCFSESRLLLLPPSVTALLVIFSRNHNYIAEKLFQLNEYGKFKPWDSLDANGKVWQDEEIFQTARLVNCGFFINVVLHDYIRAILGLNATSSAWVLDPRPDIDGVPRGTGNHSSIEFSALYSWHCTLSQADERWTVKQFEEIFGQGRDPASVSPAEFTAKVGNIERGMSQDPRDWQVPGIQRGQNGAFKDEDLASILHDATEEVAGAFGARNNPAVLKVIDTLRMATARSTWRTCTLNEFRKFVNLKPFASFEEHNRDPEVSRTLQQIYGHVDNMELYPGLLAEEAKPSIVGSGLCPGYTISRAILSDAVALTRGDRFFTTSFDRTSMTSWGIEDCSPSSDNGAYGGIMGKLLMRCLPRTYKLNSIHALFPFQTPTVMKSHLSKLEVAQKYDFARPAAVPSLRSITGREAVKTVLSDNDRFGVVYSAAIRSISKDDYGFMLGFDDQAKHGPDRAFMDAAIFPPGYVEDYTQFYTKTVENLVREHSFSLYGSSAKTIDFVRDVGTMASVYWVARNFGIPLKTKEHPHGLLTPQELYLMLTGMFIYVFILPLQDPSAGWTLRETSLRSSKLLCSLVEARLKQTKWIPKGLMPGHDGSIGDPGAPAVAFYKRMLASNRPTKELVSNCMGIMVASTTNQGEAAAHILNLYLSPEYKSSYDRIKELANRSDPGAGKELLGFVWEAMRLDPQTPCVPRVCQRATTLQDGDKTLSVAPGDFMLSSLTAVNMDPAVFSDPAKVDPHRDPALYRLFGFGMHSCLGARIVNLAQPIILKAAFRLPNLRRAPGRAGELYRFATDLAGLAVPTYVNAQSSLWPFPVSLAVEYDVTDADAS